MASYHNVDTDVSMNQITTVMMGSNYLNQIMIIQMALDDIKNGKLPQFGSFIFRGTKML